MERGLGPSLRCFPECLCEPSFVRQTLPGLEMLGETSGQGYECGWGVDAALLPHPSRIGGLVDPGGQDLRGAEGNAGPFPVALWNFCRSPCVLFQIFPEQQSQ